jgi:hypothetical protein
MYAEYVGLTPEAIALTEEFRLSPKESKSDILVRVLSPLVSNGSAGPSYLDLGQGARLSVGERPVLFLSEDSRRQGNPDAVAEVRNDGFYLDGRKVVPSRGNPLQPAMQLVQERKRHRNSRGELISLSAWRQWHVVRDGRLLSMLELKDPRLAHKRGRRISKLASHLTLKELGL